MPLDPEIALQYNPNPNIGPNWNQIYQSQNQAYRNYLQQQDIAGTNALRDAFAGGNALDPATGLPLPEIMSRVYQADPNKGLAMTEVLTKLRDEQSRTMYNNLQYAEKVGASYREDVMEPSIRMYEDLQKQGLPQEQIRNLTEENKQKLFTEWRNRTGTPDATADKLDHPFFDLNNGQGTSWPFRSTAFQKRADEVTKEWGRAKKFVDKAGNTFVLNPYYGPGAFDPVTHQPVTPVGPYHEVGTKGEAPEKPLPPGEAATVGGRPTTVYRFPNRIEEASKPGSSLDPNTVEILPKKTGGGAAAQPKEEMIRVKRPDGKEEIIPATRQPMEPGKAPTYIDKNSNPIDPATITQYNVTPSQAGQPEYSEDAVNMLSDQLMTGDPSPLRNLWGSPQLRVQVINSLANRAKTQWGDQAGVNMALMNAMFSSQEGALRAIDRQRVNVKSFEGTALREADLASNLAGKGLAGEVPVLNRWIQAGRRGIQGDADVTALNTAVTSLANEYARIMSSPGATGGITSDTARAEAAGLINNAQTPEQFASAIKTMKTSMANRVKAIDTTLGTTLKEIAEGAGVKGPLEAPETSPKTEPAPGETSGSSSTALPANVPALIDKLSKDSRFAAPGSKADIHRDPDGKGPVIGQIVRKSDGTVVWVPK